jgi:signal transduction histidine kinase
MMRLSLFWQIIALHGGTFHFPSAKGRGTKITMALPKK